MVDVFFFLAHKSNRYRRLSPKDIIRSLNFLTELALPLTSD